MTYKHELNFEVSLFPLLQTILFHFSNYLNIFIYLFTYVLQYCGLSIPPLPPPLPLLYLR